MDVEIRPGTGAGPFRFGMPVQEALTAAREWGRFRTAAADEDPGQIVLTHDDSRMDLVLGFGGGALSAVELIRFRKEDADVRVLLDGLDVFRTPSEDLLDELTGRGHTIEENDLGFDALPELRVILANQSSYEYPADEEGDPLYYDYVLVEGPLAGRRPAR
ncbi:hypothetical protein GCM10018980_30760 [Streptomyces capoamus]|uniref:Uncharacterized protein n=1 Tax=Streptomyces capoamus TaxID=68183 RepID=A0A919C4V2_9ACTN|nr:hypothetical protein [Streptomyces capoamus]GGW17928.1 hypothetical protein GCM10010501_40840 [Streptomyces libani subsp. rufus]GHG49663.1 hypothetical protein GCM10018980_30760 [Streptomyces capoamus]